MDQEQLISQIETTKKRLRYAMRALLIILAAWIVSLSVEAQVSDPYIAVSYGGYSNGQYKLIIASNQGACNADVHVQLNGKDYYGKVGTFLVKAPYNVADVFTVTDLSICSWQGSNPIALQLVIANYTTTPVTFVGNPKLTAVSGGVQVEFDVVGEINITNYVIHVTGNGKTIDMAIPVHGSGHYSTIVKL